MYIAACAFVYEPLVTTMEFLVRGFYSSRFGNVSQCMIDVLVKFTMSYVNIRMSYVCVQIHVYTIYVLRCYGLIHVLTSSNPYSKLPTQKSGYGV